MRNTLSALLGLLVLTGATSPTRGWAAKDELIEVFDQEHKPLRTASVEISPRSVDGAVEKSTLKVHVTFTGAAEADGDLLVRQIGGNEVGAFYGRLVRYKAGQNAVDLECHINPARNRSGTVIVQAVIASSYKALQGAVTTELQVAADTGVTGNKK